MYELTNETVAGRKYYARLELDDGTVLTNYGDEAVGIASISISSTLCGAESISIGCVNAASATITLETGAELENQRFTLYLGQELDGAVEWVPMGVFTATKAEFSEGKLTVEAWDDLYFAGGTYTPSDSVTGTCTLAGALADVCSQAGLTFSGMVPSLTVAGMPTGLTCSAAIGHLAALCGASACMDRDGRLVFRQFTETGQALGTDDCYSGGMVFKTSDFTVASLTNTLELETTGDDGATTTGTVEVERTTGAAGGSIALTDPLMTEANIDTAWDVVKSFTYRPATLTAVGQINLDVGDVLAVTDADGTTYSVPVMTHVLEYDGGLKSTLTATGESDTQQSAAVVGPVAQQIIALNTQVVDTKVLANGKNAVYYATVAPDPDDYTLNVNDLWFDTSGGDYSMHYWDGSAWVAAPFGTGALGEGSVTAAKIVAGAVTAEKLNVAELSAISADLGTVTAGDITGATFTTSVTEGGTIKLSEGIMTCLGDTFTVGEVLLDDGTSQEVNGQSYFEMNGGYIKLYAYGSSLSSSPIGSLSLSAVGISGYLSSSTPWFNVSNPRKAVTIGGTLDVSGAVALGDTLDVTGEATVGGDLDVTGEATVGGFRVPTIQHGREYRTISATSGNFAVTFSAEFAGVPTVVISPQHASTTTITARVYSVSTTGFTFYVTSSSTGGTVVFNWIAMY